MTKPFGMKALSPHSHDAGVSKPASAIKWLRRCEGGVKKKKQNHKKLNSLKCEISWDDLLPDILKELPFKSLCRFKCVSKFWRSIIINLSARQLPRKPIVVKQYGGADTPECHEVLRLCSIDGQSGVATHICTSPHLGVHFYPTFANGLFCYYDGNRHLIGLCNPITQEKLSLPKNQKCFSKGLSFEFGFHPISNQYKLLCCGNYPVCEIYTLGTTSWQQVRSSLSCDCGKPFTRPVCIRGTMYWYSDTDMVISFELATESFGAIQGPERLTRGPRIESRVIYLFEFEGCLCLADHHAVVEDIVDLWMLKDCDANDGCNWILMTSVASPSQGLRWIRPCSTGNGELALAYYNGSPKAFYLYSLLKQQFDVVEVIGINSEIGMVDHEVNPLSLRDL